MNTYFEKQSILDEHKKEFLRIYRKAQNAVIIMDLKNIHVEIAYMNNGKAVAFDIKGFKTDNSEVGSFTGFDFYSIEKLELQTNAVLEALKKDDFDLFKTASRWRL